MSQAKESILVAVDFGASSSRAFANAIDLARRLGAALEIVHVVRPIPVGFDEQHEPPYVDAARAQLAALQAFAEAEGVEARARLCMDTVVFGLLDEIEKLRPRLVVVGSHGRSGVRRALLGSVSEAVARRACAPVLIVPAVERPQHTADAAWSCAACGHILGTGESQRMCARCGADPAEWISAALLDQPADADQPAAGEPVAEDLVSTQTGVAGGTLTTSPPGVDGCDVNPELRVRY